MSRLKKKTSQDDLEDRLIGRALFATYATPALIAFLVGEFPAAALLGGLALSVAIAGCGTCSESHKCNAREWTDPPSK
jgi:hypothetical protein